MRPWLKPGYLLLLLLLLLPLLLALPRLITLWDGGLVSALRVLGIGAGILGTSMLLISAALSIRLPKLDQIWGGLPQIWGVHRALGFGAFVLIMVHVLLLGFAVVPVSVEAAMVLLFPPLAEWPIWLGWGALLLLVVFLAPTFQFFGRPHYQRWKRLHLLAIPATVFALAHVFPLAGEFVIWVILAVLALGAMFWRKGLSPHLGRYSYEVVAVNTLVRDVVELVLKPKGPRMPYETGQFVYLSPLDRGLSAGYNEEHPYTLSSSSADELLRIGIKDLGDASHAIQTIAVGSECKIEGPYGDFYKRFEANRHQLWLAGGIGVTPFVAGARHIQLTQQAPGSATPVSAHAHLFYLGRDSVRAYYLTELEHIDAAQANFAVTPHYFRDEGPMTAEFLAQHCPDYLEREIYMCGPPGMIAHLRALLRAQGVPTARIHSEVFDFL